MRTPSEKYKKLGEQIIADLFPELKDVKIAWLSCCKGKKQNGHYVYADCRKVQASEKWTNPYDFIITVYAPNVSGLTDEKIKILLEHEIMHIGKKGEKLYIVPHDIGEFDKIREKYGIDWLRKED